jgi:C-terminal processing protease CtpA/Prc
MRRILAFSMICVALVAFVPERSLPAQQKMDNFNLQRSLGILHDAYDEVKKHYYDTKFHGLDWDAQYRSHQERVKNAASLGQAFGIVAGMLDNLHDSHTFFRPPSRPYRVDYGYRMQAFGDTTFITRVRPGTDAESKVHPGDQVMLYNKFNVYRDNLWKMQYYFGSLAPQKASQLVLLDPAGQQRELMVDAKTQQLKKVLDLTGSDGGADFYQLIREEENSDHMVRQRYYEMGEVMIWKMPEFILEDSEVDHMFGIAKKHKALVLDLRGNPGGAVVTLERMVANVFDHDVKISDRIGRKDLKPQLAKTRGGSIFTGKVVVLVDSGSASAAELFARVMQLEHRGTVVGDRSSGSVMESRVYPCSQGMNTKFFYSFSVTDADLIMADGKSLEHTGVTPDEIVMPTAKDLAGDRDPALSRAAELAGVNIEPAKAGKMFPFEWLPF